MKTTPYLGLALSGLLLVTSISSLASEATSARAVALALLDSKAGQALERAMTRETIVPIVSRVLGITESAVLALHPSEARALIASQLKRNDPGTAEAAQQILGAFQFAGVQVPVEALNPSSAEAHILKAGADKTSEVANAVDPYASNRALLKDTQVSEAFKTQILEGLSHFDAVYHPVVAKIEGPLPAIPKYRLRELDKAITALNAPDKGHLLIIGEAGIGKSAFVNTLTEILVRSAQANVSMPASIVLKISNPGAHSMDAYTLSMRALTAKLLADATNRGVVLWLDDAEVLSPALLAELNSLLTDPRLIRRKVHIVVSGVGSKILTDSLQAPELVTLALKGQGKVKALEMIRSLLIPQWRDSLLQSDGLKLEDVSDETLELAFANAGLTQATLDDPLSGTVGILHGAMELAVKKAESSGSIVVLDEAQIREYVATVRK